MTAFLTPLRVEELDDTSADGRGTWMLFAPLAYRSDLLGRTIIVPSGFITDFASTPRIPVLYELAGNLRHKAAVIHDYLYTTQEVPREVADAVLREAMAAIDARELQIKAEGAGRIKRAALGVLAWFYAVRRNAMYAGVRVGGGSHWATPGQEQSPRVLAQMEAP